MASTQCKRRACNIADVPSIRTRTATVSINQNANKNTTINTASGLPGSFEENELAIVIFQRTVDNCACAKERAHKRKYEAVCEIQFRQNSIV